VVLEQRAMAGAAVGFLCGLVIAQAIDRRTMGTDNLANISY
jgi:hypothetical protein